MNFTSELKPKYIEVSAVVTRADGTVEDLGVIASKHYTFWGWLSNQLKLNNSRTHKE